jgi:hypothetical protein
MNLTSRAGRRLAAGIALACSAILLPAAALASPAAPGTQTVPPRRCCRWPALLPVLPPILSGGSSR